MKLSSLFRRPSISSRAPRFQRTRLEVLESRIAPAAIITGSLTDNTATAVLPGGTILYTEVISNTGDASALNLQISHVVNNANFVAGSLNISPLAFDDAFTAIGNTTLVVGGSAPATPAKVLAGSLFANDVEFANDLGTLDTFTLLGFMATSANGGTVTVAADGSFTYLPAVGFTGTDTFTYTITDDGVTGLGAANSAALTGTGTVTITVAEKVWYVDDSAAPGGTGRSNSPFNSLANVNGAGDVDGANDYLYFFAGNYGGAFTLEGSQHLIGEGANLVVSGFTLKTGAVANRPVFSHSAATTITLSAGNEVRGLNVTNSAGTGISGNAVGTLTMADFDVTVTGGSALSLTTSGTVTVTGSDNDLAATNGVALNLANVNIAAAGLTFKSVSASGAASGIVLNTTGSSGGLTVTGDGGGANNGSGGTIQNTTSHGIVLNSTSSVILGYMNVQNSGDDGLFGQNVTGFALNRSMFSNNGNGVGDNGLDFGDSASTTPSGLLGTASITNSTVTTSFERDVVIRNSSGSLALTVTGSTFSNSSAKTQSDDGMLLEVLGTGSITANVMGNSFSANRGDHFQAAASNSGNINITFKANTLTGGHSTALGSGITINAATGVAFGGYTGRINYDIDGNTINGAISSAITVNLGTSGSAGTFNGFVRNNIIGTAASADSGSAQASGIAIDAHGNGTHTSSVTGNVVRQAFDRAISVFVNDGTTGVLNLTVQNNDLQVGTNALGSREAFFLNNGSTTTNVFGQIDGATVRLDLNNNTLIHGVGSADDFRIRQRFNSRIELPGYAGTAFDTAAVISYVQGRNTGSAGEPGSATANDSATVVTDGFFGGSVTLPTATPLPLFLAPTVNLPTSSETTASVDVEDGVLSQGELDSLVLAAISRWEATGLSAEQSALIRGVTFSVANLAPRVLGQASPGMVTLDDDGAGNGWFVDATPLDDSEFVNPNGIVASRVDAVTTVMHELGHALGLDDSYATADSASIMYGFLTLGLRRGPVQGQADGAVPSGDATTDFAFSPYTIGTLPAGKSVTLNFAATVPTNTTATSATTQGTITATGGINVLTDDPAAGGAADVTTTAIDLPDVSIAVAPGAVAEDGAGTLVYTFTRTGLNDFTRVVNFAASGVALFGGAGADYTLSGGTFDTGTGLGTVTFAANSATATITLSATDDTTVETNETAVLTVTAGAGYDVTGGPASGTITNDDTDIAVTVAPASVLEDGAGNLLFTFTRTGVTSGALTVNFSVGGTATFNTDYTQTGAATFAASAGTVSFLAGETTKVVTLDPSVDSTVEANETALLTVTAGAGYNIAGTAATGTITNDDADVALTVLPTSVNEDGVPNLVYTFTRSGFTAGSLTVNFSVGGTATFNTDYTQAGAVTFTATTGTVTFGAGATTATVTLDPTLDVIAEVDETTLLTLTAGAGYNIATAGAVTGTIVDDDTSVTLAILPNTVVEDGAGTMVYTFTRTGNTAAALTVNFNVGGTAAFSTDYTQAGAATFTASAGTVTFTAGSATATVTLDPTADATVEVDETTLLTLAAGAGYGIGTAGAVSGTITNDDTDISVAVAPASVLEDGAGNLLYTFTRTGVATGALTVNFSVGGTATFATDYTQTGAATFAATTGTVTFGAGATTVTVTIDPTADTTVELDETALLTVTAGAGYNIAGSAATGTIANDDTDVTFAILPASVSEDGAPNLVYTFTRAGVTASALTVNFSVGGTATFNTDYTQAGAATFATAAGTVTFAAGATTATVTLNPTADSTVEADETTLLTLTAGSYNIATAGAVAGTITNDDTDVTLAVAPASVSEDGAPNLVYTFTRTGVTAGALTVNFSVGGTATFNTDYTQAGATTFAAAAGTVTFAAGSATAIVTLDPSADTTVEADETTVLTMTAGAGYTALDIPVTGTITSDDTDIAVTVAPASLSEDGAGFLVYTFTRTGVTTGALTANYSLGGTATFFGADFGVTVSGSSTYNVATSTGTILFAAGVTSVNITVDPTADAVTEADETAIMTVTAGAGYNIANTAATGTITNDDATVSVAVSPASVTEDGAANLVYTFTRTGLLTSALTVDFTVGGSATFNTDYTQTGAATFAAAAGTVTFAANSATATITIDPTADTDAESDETAVLTLAASGAGYTSANPTAATGTISNDDTVVTLAIAPSTVTEDGAATLVYTFTRTGPTTSALTVNFNVAGTAAFGTDYAQTGAATFAASAGTVTIAAGSATATVTLDPTANATVEVDETTLLTLATGAGYGIGTATAVTGTITNDDTDISVAVAPASVAEDGAGNLVYTFTRTGVTTGALTVNFSITGPGTLTSTDYSVLSSAGVTFDAGAATGMVAFAAGETTKTVTVDPAAEVFVESDENVIATVTSGAGYNVIGTPATGTIVNDDTDVSLALSPTTVAEDGAANLVYTFTRAGVTSGALTVNFIINVNAVSPMATLNVDYTASGADVFLATGGMVTFAPGATTATVTLDPIADTTVESDEGVVLELAAGAGYTPITFTQLLAVIANDDTDVTLSVAPASVIEDNAGTLVYTFTRTGVTTGEMTVNFDVAGTATFATDYTQSGAATFGATAGTVTFLAGGTTATVSLTSVVDSTVEADETALLTLASGIGYNVPSSSATGTITNDDTDIAVSIMQASVKEDGSDNLVFTFTRTGVTTGAVAAGFTLGGTASIAGFDFGFFAPSPAVTFNAATGVGTVTFATGETTVQVTIDPRVDSTLEPDETAIVTVTPGSGYNIAGTAATGTIETDDVDLLVSVADDGESVIRGQVVTYTIKYSNVGNLGVTGAFITQTVPANTFFSSGASTAGWTFIGSNTYSLNVGDIASGAPEETATFSVFLFPVIPGGYNALSTTSTISSLTKDVTEATPADNISTDTTTIYQGIYVVSPGVSLPGRGAPPAIRVFDIATGTETNINAYEPTYRKSIRVATGDINGDGYDDIITSTITGNGRVRVFDGRTGAPMTGAFAELAAFPEAGARGAYVASGDVNGDGRDDIVVGSGYKAKGSAKVRVFSGIDGSVLSTNEPFGTKFRGGVRVAVADGEGGFDNRSIVPRGGIISNGVAEIIASQGFGGNRVVVTSGISNTVLKDFTVGGARYKGGVFVAAAADLTGDGIVDFIVGRDRGRTVVETFNGATGALLSTITPFAANYKLGARVAAADVNLDGIADIIVGSGGRNAGSVKFFDGVTNAEMTARTFSAFPTFPNGAVFVAGSSPVPHPQLT